MFNDMNSVLATMRTMTDDQLSQVVVLALSEVSKGNITESQAEMVVTVVAGIMVERVMAERELAAGATVN
jgi:hypothetical protein